MVYNLVSIYFDSLQLAYTIELNFAKFRLLIQKYAQVIFCRKESAISFSAKF